MKFGQLTVYNMRNILLEKSNKKCGGKTSPRPFPKKSKLSIFLDQQSKALYNLLLLYVQGEGYQNILKLRWRPFAFTAYTAFPKNKRKSGTSLLASFSTWFLKKNIPHVIFY